MDPLSLVELARTLVDIDSTTGAEGDCGRWLAAYLRARGWRVEEQPVTDTRCNVLATLDAPRVAFSTHFDCVPPFFPSRIEGTRVYGRGSCDAKGILAAQVTAAERLRREGITDVGLLFVVGVFSIVALSTSNTLLQLEAKPELLYAIQPLVTQ